MKYGRSADTFFTKEEREKIEKTIRDVESRTIGEVAVMVVESSDRYAEAEILGGVFLGSLAALAVTVLYFHASLWSYVPLSFLFSVPAWLLFRRLPLMKSFFIGIGRREEAVRQRAVRAFYERGLYRTKENTGVLFFFSLLERKVWVLADRGIYEKIDQATLDQFARTITEGIREGRACDALCEDMREAGDLLARHFPKTPDDTDELSNRILTE